ncbi:MAG: hypothetical protein JO108_24225 [Acidobacteriaceae bacterium]|nr:hypothetical protein [Acidobacteriaceae bacterium]
MRKQFFERLNGMRRDTAERVAKPGEGIDAVSCHDPLVMFIHPDYGDSLGDVVLEMRGR